MLSLQGRPVANLPDSKLAAIFEKQLAEVSQWLAQRPNFQVLQVRYQDVIETPLPVTQQIATFLSGEVDHRPMAAAVEPKLYRQRHVFCV
jgi:hypothetical protein